MTAVGTRELTVSALGTPAPQGSKSFKGMRAGKPVLVESSKAVGPWRDAVALAARAALNLSGLNPFDEPVHVDLDFFLPRPPSIPRRRIYPAVKPDIDKLVRSTLDALVAARVLVEDSRVVSLTATKHYAHTHPGARITIRSLERTTTP